MTRESGPKGCCPCRGHREGDIMWQGAWRPWTAALRLRPECDQARLEEGDWGPRVRGPVSS